MNEENRLLAIGQLKQQCCEPLICKQHGDPLPCNLCDGESSSIVCNKCQREISQLPLDLKSHEHPCQSVEIYRSEGKIIFETDPLLEAEYLRKEQEIRLALEHAENEKRRLEREAEERNRIQREREAAERNRVQRERDEAERTRIRHEREAAEYRAREAVEIERQRVERETKASENKPQWVAIVAVVLFVLHFPFFVQFLIYKSSGWPFWKGLFVEFYISIFHIFYYLPIAIGGNKQWRPDGMDYFVIFSDVSILVSSVLVYFLT